MRIASRTPRVAQRAVVREQRLVGLQLAHQPLAVAVEVDRAAEHLAERRLEAGHELGVGHLAALERAQRRLGAREAVSVIAWPSASSGMPSSACARSNASLSGSVITPPKSLMTALITRGG